MQLNRTHQLLVYANDVNLLGDSMGTVKKNTNTFNYWVMHSLLRTEVSIYIDHKHFDASKKVGLEVNAKEINMNCCPNIRMLGKIMK
jgi:hypothetical protein